MKPKYKLAVVVLCYNEEHYLEECISSIQEQSYNSFDLVLVDNNSSDGSVSLVKEKFPQVRIIENKSNLGFAVANNIAMKTLFGEGYDICILLNSDIKADKKYIENLIKTYEIKKNKNKVGLIQPLIMLYDSPNLINSSGIAVHYLGFGYAGDYFKKNTTVTSDKEIFAAAGGASLFTKNFFEDTGGFDESFFMYCEDQNISWRGFILGYKHFLSHKSLLYHKYKFNKNKKKLFYYERNRLFMFFENYSLRSVLILFPMFIFNEILIIFYSIINGWFFKKINSYLSFLLNIKTVIKKRKQTQKIRIISDYEVFNKMICSLEFKGITNYLFLPLNFFYCLFFRLIKSFYKSKVV